MKASDPHLSSDCLRRRQELALLPQLFIDLYQIWMINIAFYKTKPGEKRGCEEDAEKVIEP